MKFGTDGVRGRANTEIGPELAMTLGNAMVGVLGPRIAVARDTRPSGPMLEAAVVAGICAAGGTAIRCGVLPTPGLSALVAAHGWDGGVMVTASHNPAHDNGLKALDRAGHKVEGAVRAALEAQLALPIRLADTPGGVVEVADAGEQYVGRVLAALPEGRWLADRLVVVDTANGAGAGLATRVLAALGARVVAIGDGEGAINDGCGALHPEALAERVREVGADAGIALDGDGDRVALSDATGRVLDGDALLWLCRAGDVVVGTVMTNGGLEAALAGEGRRLVRAAVGDANVAADMRASGAAVGGEPSGHVLFADGLPTADGLLAGLRALHPDPRALAERLSGYVPFTQVNTAVRVPGERVARTTAEQLRLREAGARVVVRPSGTEPVVRIMVEHADPSFAEAAAERLVAQLIADA